MVAVLRWIFYRVFVMGIIRIALGLNARHRERLPQDGPAVVIANHNSHLDTMLLVALLPGHLLPKVRPVAAADYFLRNRLLAWFAERIVGIIPIRRGGGKEALQGASEALDRGDILIFFPEGTRGEPEQLSAFKSGLWHLLRDHPSAPVHPVFMHGLGKAMPRGEGILVPFFVDVYVGDPFSWQLDRRAFMEELAWRMNRLAAKVGLDSFA